MDHEEEVEASILPPSSPHAVPAKRKRNSKSSTLPMALDGGEAAIPSKPKKKRAKLAKGSDEPAANAADIADIDDGSNEAGSGIGKGAESSVVMAGPTTIRIKLPKRPDEAASTTTDMILDELDDDGDTRAGTTEQAGVPRLRESTDDSWGTPPPAADREEQMTDDAEGGNVPPPQSDRSFPSNSMPGSSNIALPPPPALHGTFAQQRMNMLRNLRFKGDPNTPFVNSGSPPISHSSTPPRTTAPPMAHPHVRAHAAEWQAHQSPESEHARINARYTPGRSQGDETEFYLGAGNSRAPSEEPGHAHPRSDSPLPPHGEHESHRGPGSLFMTNYPDYRMPAGPATPGEYEGDPYDNPELQGQYKTAFRPEPPKKKQVKKKRTIRPVPGVEGAEGSVDGSNAGMEHEGTPGGTENGEAGAAPVKKRKRMAKPPGTEDANSVGTWRRGLKKGETRAHAIAKFRENNPGQPLPPGWDFPAPPAEKPAKPAAVRMISFRKEPTPPPREPKGDILSYVSVQQNLAPVSGEEELLAENKQDIVMTSEPSRPVATALKIDITKADETDFEKLNIDIGEPLQDPEADAIPANIGHPVFRHHVEMQGLPVLKAVDPSKVVKERDIVCPRELKENLSGQPRRFVQKELSVTGIGGYQLKFKTWTGDAGKSTWRTQRDERFAEQQRAAEEAMMNDPSMLGPDGTPLAGVDGTFDENGFFIPASTTAPTKGKRGGGLTKTGKQRKPWTKKADKGDANKRILDSLKRQEGSPSVVGTPDLGTAAVNSEVASSPAPMPELDDTIVSQADYSRPPSPMPGLSVAGDDVDAEMEDLL